MCSSLWYFTLFLRLIISTSLHAQFGIRLGNNINTFPDFNRCLAESYSLNEKRMFANTIELGLDY